jgi:hypothetical protein
VTTTVLMTVGGAAQGVAKISSQPAENSLCAYSKSRPSALMVVMDDEVRW